MENLDQGMLSFNSKGFDFFNKKGFDIIDEI